MEPLGKEHNQKVMRALHDQGIEMTPAELEAIRKSAYAKIRSELHSRGLHCPDDDKDLLVWMKQVLGK